MAIPMKLSAHIAGTSHGNSTLGMLVRCLILVCAVPWRAISQIVPPMVQPSVVVQKKQPHLNPIILSWPSSLAADLGSYLLEGLTNGVVFETTNTKSTSALFSCWSGQTNAYRLYAISTNGIMAPIYASLTHSGWSRDFQYVLAISTNGVLYTNAYAVDSTNLSGDTFFRSGIGLDVVFQSSTDTTHWKNLYDSDVDNFPSDFTAIPQVKQSTINVP
jgi:hypothetical protein